MKVHQSDRGRITRTIARKLVDASLSRQPDDSIAGNHVGNHYDKYHSRNPVTRWLMSGFLGAAAELYRLASPRRVLEVGCGEGYLANFLLQCSPPPDRFEACDLSLDRVSRTVNPLIQFREASIYDLPYADGEFELVVCCEVLEHLDDPATGMAELARVSERAVLLSVPREPLWRLLNLLRVAYWSSCGNTPGHVQHFSRRGLRRLAETQLQITAERTPLPWCMLLGEPHAPDPTVRQPGHPC